MVKAFKTYLKKKKQPKTKEEIIKEVLAYSLAIVVFFILAMFFRPIATYADNYGYTMTDNGPKIYDTYENGNHVSYEYDEIELQVDSSSGGFLSNFVGDHIIDPVLEGLISKAISWVNIAIEFVVKLISNCFKPSITPLVALETGTNIELEAATSTFGTGFLESSDPDGHITLGDSVIMGSIWKFSMYFGFATATLIALFNLMLCVFGRSQDIKDSPAGIGLKYALAILLIILSRSFMTGFINLFGDIWQNFIFDQTLLENMNGSGFASCFIPAKTIQGGAVLVLFSTVSVPLLTLSATGPGAIIALLIFIVMAIMGFKLLSEMIKLFLEIVERYFVFFILIAFFPALAATITTNNSKKIFYAYMKMVYTQGFLLIINTVFMSLFVYVLLNGGWTAGLLNYLAALAFLRVCQRIDAYMAQMGFNVVQTGAGLAGAMGGAGLGFLSAMKGMQALNKGRQNIGNGIKDLGLRTNNSGLAKAGAMFGASGRDILGGGLSNEGLSKTIIDGQAAYSAGIQNGNGAGRIGELDNSSWDAVHGSMTDFGMSDMQANQTIASLQAAGYEPSDCRSIMQNDNDAKCFSIGDSSEETGGGMFATVDGTQSDILDKAERDAVTSELAGISGSDNEKANVPSSSYDVPSGLSESMQQYNDSTGVTSQLRQDAYENESVSGRIRDSFSDSEDSARSSGSSGTSSGTNSGSSSESGSNNTSSSSRQNNETSSSSTTSVSTNISTPSTSLSSSMNNSRNMDVSRQSGVRGEYTVKQTDRGRVVETKVYAAANHPELRNNPKYNTISYKDTSGQTKRGYVKKKSSFNGNKVKNTPSSPTKKSGK